MVTSKGRKKALFWLLAAIAVFLAVAALFVLRVVPNPADITREQLLSATLRKGIPRSDIVAFLQESHASWHNGDDFKNGETIASWDLGSRCSTGCKGTLQVVFYNYVGFCETLGDIYTLKFDDNGRLKSWQRWDAVDGC